MATSKRPSMVIRFGVVPSLLSKSTNGSISLSKGIGVLVDENTVKVGKNLYLRGEHVVLACGSKPKERHTSPEDVLTGKVLPRGKVLIEGSGASACELSFILSTFGYHVYLRLGREGSKKAL